MPVVAVEAGPDEAVPVVAVDQVAGAAAATRHLLELGHDRQGVRRPASTATTGTSAAARPARRAEPSSGAMTRMPSTPCMRSRSTALRTEARSSASRLTMLDEVALVVRGALDPEQRRRRPVQRRVEAHHAERARAPGDERARRGVRAVVELRIARRTRSRVSVRPARLSLSTRETVWWETPASLATSAMTAGAAAALSPAAGLAGRAHSGSSGEGPNRGSPRLSLGGHIAALTAPNVNDNNGARRPPPRRRDDVGTGSRSRGYRTARVAGRRRRTRRARRSRAFTRRAALTGGAAGLVSTMIAACGGDGNKPALEQGAERHARQRHLQARGSS